MGNREHWRDERDVKMEKVNGAGGNNENWGQLDKEETKVQGWRIGVRWSSNLLWSRHINDMFHLSATCKLQSCQFWCHWKVSNTHKKKSEIKKRRVTWTQSVVMLHISYKNKWTTRGIQFYFTYIWGYTVRVHATLTLLPPSLCMLWPTFIQLSSTTRANKHEIRHMVRFIFLIPHFLWGALSNKNLSPFIADKKHLEEAASLNQFPRSLRPHTQSSQCRYKVFSFSCTAQSVSVCHNYADTREPNDRGF